MSLKLLKDFFNDILTYLILLLLMKIKKCLLWGHSKMFMIKIESFIYFDFTHLNFAETLKFVNIRLMQNL